MQRAQAVHHIVHRGKASEDRIWRLENMVSICNRCHAGADAKEARGAQLSYLVKRHGYKYPEQPWQGLLRAWGSVAEGDLDDEHSDD